MHSIRSTNLKKSKFSTTSIGASGSMSVQESRRIAEHHIERLFGKTEFSINRFPPVDRTDHQNIWVLN